MDQVEAMAEKLDYEYRVSRLPSPVQIQLSSCKEPVKFILFILEVLRKTALSVYKWSSKVLDIYKR